MGRLAWRHGHWTLSLKYAPRSLQLWRTKVVNAAFEWTHLASYHTTKTQLATKISAIALLINGPLKAPWMKINPTQHNQILLFSTQVNSIQTCFSGRPKYTLNVSKIKYKKISIYSIYTWPKIYFPRIYPLLCLSLKDTHTQAHEQTHTQTHRALFWWRKCLA